jgi:hypothetical protein
MLTWYYKLHTRTCDIKQKMGIWRLQNTTTYHYLLVYHMESESPLVYIYLPKAARACTSQIKGSTCYYASLVSRELQPCYWDIRNSNSHPQTTEWLVGPVERPALDTTHHCRPLEYVHTSIASAISWLNPESIRSRVTQTRSPMNILSDLYCPHDSGSKIYAAFKRK